MPATSKLQLYNFGNAFERATKSILESAGVGETFIQGANRKLPRTRLELIFQTGEPINQGRNPSGDLVYDYWQGFLSVRIVTHRMDDQPSLVEGVSRLHEEFAAGVRVALEERKSACGEYVTAFTTDNLPFYKVKKIRPMQESRDLDPRFAVDFTRLPFFMEFGIRSDAWPA